jgi:hypothetical protein
MRGNSVSFNAARERRPRERKLGGNSVADLNPPARPKPRNPSGVRSQTAGDFELLIAPRERPHEHGAKMAGGHRLLACHFCSHSIIYTKLRLSEMASIRRLENIRGIERLDVLSEFLRRENDIKPNTWKFHQKNEPELRILVHKLKLA